MIKACDPEATIPLVWRRDEAVDQEASGPLDQLFLVESMVNPLTWRNKLKFKDGAKPTEFIMGVTPPSELNAAEDTEGTAARTWHVFLHSVRNIKNAGPLTAHIPSGKLPMTERNGVKYVDPEWLAVRMVGPLRQCANELGLITYTWNNLQETDAKNS